MLTANAQVGPKNGCRLHCLNKVLTSACLANPGLLVDSAGLAPLVCVSLTSRSPFFNSLFLLMTITFPPDEAWLLKQKLSSIVPI